MALIELRGVSHAYAGSAKLALAPLDLRFESGRAYALLGPSGCGKTTLLSIISGLIAPSSGRIAIDGRDVTEARPERRNIAQVFQFPVIYDTMSVFDNLAFPLRNRRVPSGQIARRVAQIAELLELGAALKQRASGLSAELKQRISLGRGLVREDVAAILLDEPLTVIDPHLKGSLRQKLREVQRDLAMTLIYVTHDQGEALTLADEVLVMNEGRVLQKGTPEALFERPAHPFVGYFIGSPGMNLLPLTVEAGRASIAGQPIMLPAALAAEALAAREPLLLGVRPEFLRLRDGAAGETGSALSVTVEGLEETGAARIIRARLGELRVAIKTFDARAAVELGGRYFLELPPEHTLVYAAREAPGRSEVP